MDSSDLLFTFKAENPQTIIFDIYRGEIYSLDLTVRFKG